MFYVKKSEKTETLYLQTGYRPKMWFYTEGSPIYGDEKCRATKWRLVFREEDQNRIRIDGEVIEKWPYETFDMEDVWGDW